VYRTFAKDKLALAKKRLKIANRVRCSPKFNWNTKSKEGLIQLKATISFISQDDLLNVEHAFNWTDVVLTRSYEVVMRIDRLIDESEEYFIDDI
jgi:hypothetical protein